MIGSPALRSLATRHSSLLPKRSPIAMAAAGSKRRNIWLDCDVGVDDAQALMLALSAPEVELVGVSAVHGNVGVTQVGRNIGRILTLCGRPEVPFFLGADEPLVAPSMDASYFHGEDGLGDRPDAFPPYSDVDLQSEPGHAAMHLAAAAQEHEGELTVVATGPLTNIALAAKVDEGFPQRVGRLIVMGGAEKEGNVTPTAEYNFHCDPESAHVVFRKFREVLLVSWECTLRHTLPAPWVAAWLAKPTAKARFMAAVMAKSLAYEQQRDAALEEGGDPAGGWNACDALAALLAVCNEALLEAEPRHCTVELQGANTRGMSVLQRPSAALPANTLLARKVCMQQYQRAMEAATD
ncbi:hypothetical protein ABPG75_009030 [Micractinium tetrahymenae]